MGREKLITFYFLFHRARIAFLAISLRRLGDNALALAVPPLEALSLLRTTVRELGGASLVTLSIIPFAIWVKSLFGILTI